MHASTCNRSYHNFKIRTNIRIRCRPCSRLLWCRPVECCAWARQLVRQPAAPSNGPNGHTGSVFTSQVRAGVHVALLWVRLFATRSPAKQRGGGVAPPGSEQADGRRRVPLAVAMNRRSWSTHRRPRCSEPLSARNIRRAPSRRVILRLLSARRCSGHEPRERRDAPPKKNGGDGGRRDDGKQQQV